MSNPKVEVIFYGKIGDDDAYYKVTINTNAENEFTTWVTDGTHSFRIDNDYLFNALDEFFRKKMSENGDE